MEYFDCGKRLRALQDAKTLSSVDLAHRVGITPQQLTRWRHTENLKLHTIQKICAGLGISLDVFFKEG